jgi:fermentation-respiration switch protein FrsA (DUF1100 family)
MDKRKIKHLLVGEFSFRRCLRSLAFVYITVAIYVFVMSNSMIFPPKPSSYTDSQDMERIPREDGGFLSGIHLVNSNAYFTVLFSHGNAEDLGDLRGFLEDYCAHGYSVLAYDYQGYGTSGGHASEANAYKDIQAAYTYLVQSKGIPADRILAHGRSVGSGPATFLASREQLGGLMLESAFVSAFRVVLRIPIFPFDRFPNLRRIGRVTCPVLVIHGKADTTIPWWHGEKLFAAANEPKKFLWIDAAGHDDLSGRGDEYWQGLLSFRNSLVQRGP